MYECVCGYVYECVFGCVYLQANVCEHQRERECVSLCCVCLHAWVCEWACGSLCTNVCECVRVCANVGACVRACVSESPGAWASVSVWFYLRACVRVSLDLPSARAFICLSELKVKCDELFTSQFSTFVQIGGFESLGLFLDEFIGIFIAISISPSMTCSLTNSN